METKLAKQIAQLWIQRSLEELDMAFQDVIGTSGEDYTTLDAKQLADVFITTVNQELTNRFPEILVDFKDSLENM
jgi:uncharacterized FlgJ-related protein